MANKKGYTHRFVGNKEIDRLIQQLTDQYSLTKSALIRMLVKKEARFSGLLDYEGQRKPGT